jgi:hypothetical protein
VRRIVTDIKGFDDRPRAVPAYISRVYWNGRKLANQTKLTGPTGVSDKLSDPTLISRRDILYRLGALGAGAVLPKLLADASQPVPSGPTTAATVTIAATATGVIGPAFAGLSYEKSQMANPFFSPQNADAIGLFKLIGPSLLRIGGNSVDKTTWTPNGSGRTSGQVAPSDIDALAGFLKATGWQVLYGTNLATSTPALAAAEIAYAVQSLGASLYGIEIGNEVDLFAGNYFPSTWNFSDYLQLKNVILLSNHYYRGNGAVASSTVELLISPDANIVTQAKAMLAVSQSADVPYRFAETNSFYNGGAPNVSDSYGSALWVIDHLFACASNGAQGINLHVGGDGAGYTPIADSNGVVVQARPEFYGVTLFTLAGQGTLRQTTITVGGLNASAYAIAAANGALSIIINNKDQAQNLNVTIQLPQNGAAGPAHSDDRPVSRRHSRNRHSRLRDSAQWSFLPQPRHGVPDIWLFSVLLRRSLDCSSDSSRRSANPSADCCLFRKQHNAGNTGRGSLSITAHPARPNNERVCRPAIGRALLSSLPGDRPLPNGQSHPRKG